MKHLKSRVEVVIVDPWSCIKAMGFSVLHGPSIVSWGARLSSINKKYLK